jgi:hypothetical protein
MKSAIAAAVVAMSFAAAPAAQAHNGWTHSRHHGWNHSWHAGWNHGWAKHHAIAVNHSFKAAGLH